MTRWWMALAVVGVVAAACSGDASGPVRTQDVTAVTVDQVPGGPREETPSALDDPADERFPTPIVDVNGLRSGGPPPDGIPPIDEPRFLDAADVDFLEDSEPVLALEIAGDARAYPLQIMTCTRS
jgi:hypothetical protein